MSTNTQVYKTFVPNTDEFGKVIGEFEVVSNYENFPIIYENRIGNIPEDARFVQFPIPHNDGFSIVRSSNDGLEIISLEDSDELKDVREKLINWVVTGKDHL